MLNLKIRNFVFSVLSSLGGMMYDARTGNHLWHPFSPDPGLDSFPSVCIRCRCISLWSFRYLWTVCRFFRIFSQCIMFWVHMIEQSYPKICAVHWQAMKASMFRIGCWVPLTYTIFDIFTVVRTCGSEEFLPYAFWCRLDLRFSASNVMQRRSDADLLHFILCISDPLQFISM